MSGPAAPPATLVLWGGVEATINRVGERYFNQLERSGHLERDDDIDRFAALGIRALRYPVLWESIAPDGLAQADWRVPDRRLAALRRLGVQPIAGLVHHGSGPRHTSLVDPGFAAELAAYAGAVAQRYPWLEYYTPVNEPLTTARFSALYGFWYPHARDDATFVRALLGQCRAVVLSMRAIRRINPLAKLVQTEDLGKNYGTLPLAATVAFYNQRRWLSWDLLCGMVTPQHGLWGYLTAHGVAAGELDWFREHACTPDIIGANYYVTSERWLDHRRARYPAQYGGAGYADIEAARALATPLPGIGPLLDEAWLRYGLPIAITETHIDAHREDQLRWLMETWQAALTARQRGVDVRAVTGWALLGSFDWNCLVTQAHGYYESGAFDLRAPQPRATAVAGLMRELADGRAPSSPVLAGPGWWRRPERFFCQPVGDKEGGRGGVDATPVRALEDAATGVAIGGASRPLLIAAGSEALGRAFGRVCDERGLAHLLLTREAMDITDLAQVEAAIAQHRPWAIVNAGGWMSGEQGGPKAALGPRASRAGAATLAGACAWHTLQLLTFSGDQVFDGGKGSAYLESDGVAPSGPFGRDSAEAEQCVLSIMPSGLVIRCGPMFSPWDGGDGAAMLALYGASAAATCDLATLAVSPSYVPDLVHCCLDLLVDKERGIWHLSNSGAITLGAMCDLLDRRDEIAAPSLTGQHGAANLARAPGAARRPRSFELASERAWLMPALSQALARYARERAP